MKPNFALSLSSEGIRLLHRAPGGWLLVGRVDVAAPDMAEALAVLRKTAASLDPTGVRTKIVLPDDQIRFLSIDTGRLDSEARREAAARALDGATPYTVDALAFDIAADGEMTHVAAVARETIAEAEAFAVAHRFHPVSVVAAPKAAPFPGEPFFGRTNHADTLLGAETPVEPDRRALKEIGDHDLPESRLTLYPPLAGTGISAEYVPEPDEADEPTEQADADAALEPEEILDREFAFAHRPWRDDARDAAPDTPVATETKPSFASRRAAAPGATPPPPEAETARDLSGIDAIEPPGSSEATALGDSFDRPASEPQPDLAALGGFLSRRRARRDIAPETELATRLAPPQPAPPPPNLPRPQSEADRLTIFGARNAVPPVTAPRPRRAGLLVSLLLLVTLGGVAVWSATRFGGDFSGLFPSRQAVVDASEAQVIEPEPEAPETASADPAPPDTEATEAAFETDAPPTQAPENVQIVAPEALPSPQPDTAPDDPAPVELAALEPGLRDEDAAVLDALRETRPEPGEEIPLGDSELEARYAATGIWPRAPIVPEAAGVLPLEDVYLTSIDPVSPSLDAIALPHVDTLQGDETIATPADPPPAGTILNLDPRGLVRPTPEGVLTPDGAFVILGSPPKKPPQRPADQVQPEPEDPARSALAERRPLGRPSGLVESNERATLGGLTRTELAGIRPLARPESAQDTAPVETAPTAPAVAESLRPNTRPRGFDRLVARALPAPTPAPATAPAPADTAAATVAPRIPSSTSVSREATIKNALNLNRVNLIGVYGKPSERRALVRLANGRYQKVKVGDRIDGGRVSAIGDAELRYRKGGRSIVLKMPKT